MLKAKNLMRTRPFTLPLETEVTTAIKYFKENEISSLPIASGAKKYHGMLTETGLLQIFLRYQASPKQNMLAQYRKYLQPVQFVNEDETFPDIVKKLMASTTHVIFVIDGEFNVVGSISFRDVLPLLSDLNPSEHELGAELDQVVRLKSDLYFYESFFNFSPFMMHSADPEGVIQMANQILHTTLKYENGALIGKTIFDIYPPENHEKARAGLKQIFSHGYHKLVEVQMVCRTGEIINVELASRMLRDQTNRPMGSITVARPTDTTDLFTVFASIE